MTDITPAFNGILKGHEAAPARRKSFSIDNLDEFLKEAYKIVSSSGTPILILGLIGSLFIDWGPRNQASRPSMPTLETSDSLTSRRPSRDGTWSAHRRKTSSRGRYPTGNAKRSTPR